MNGGLYEVSRRVNHVLSAVIRAQPELWNWTLSASRAVRPRSAVGIRATAATTRLGFPPQPHRQVMARALLLLACSVLVLGCGERTVTYDADGQVASGRVRVPRRPMSSR